MNRKRAMLYIFVMICCVLSYQVIQTLLSFRSDFLSDIFIYSKSSKLQHETSDFYQDGSKDPDYYAELSAEEVYEVMKDVIIERQEMKKARERATKDIWLEPDSVAANMAKEMYEKGEDETMEYNVTVWTMGFNIAHVFDIQQILRPLGVKIINRSYSSLCHYIGSCAEDIFLFDRNALLDPPNLYKSFALEYARNLTEVNSADAIMCLYPVLLCSLFRSLFKPVIFLAANRYELGHSHTWKMWNYYVNDIEWSEENTLAATNSYDARYIYHFTGSFTKVIVPHCGYINKFYEPSIDQIFVYPGARESFMDNFVEEIIKAIKPSEYKENLVIVYNKTGLPDLRHYKAVIYIPYKVSSFLFTEMYRMNIPIYVPSLSLLISWENTERLLADRVLPNSTKDLWKGGSLIDDSYEESGIPDPNMYTKNTLMYWLKHLEYYNLPGVQYFDSIENLLTLLTVNTSYDNVSETMEKHNQKIKKDVELSWKDTIKKIKQHKQKAWF